MSSCRCSSFISLASRTSARACAFQSCISIAAHYTGKTVNARDAQKQLRDFNEGPRSLQTRYCFSIRCFRVSGRIVSVPDSDYLRYRFSATCQTADSAVLHCLRALCQWAEKYPKPQIGWGGTTQSNWEESAGKLTLRFTSSEYRQNFIDRSKELLGDRWHLIATNDNDPAKRQRPPR